MLNSSFSKIYNFTNLSDDEALSVLDRLRNLMLRGEETRKLRLERAEEAMKIWKMDLWDGEDKKFFESLGIQPYQFPMHRTYLNSLITTQRQRRFKYEIVPRDIHSYNRLKKNKEAFVQKALMEGEFETVSEAEEYFDNYGDDRYARALSAMLQVIRDESKAKDVEDDAFENGVITGAHFLKSIYSTRYNREGSIEISGVSQRAMIWDESSVEYDLKDIEFIGEVHTLYKDQLKQLYPQHAEHIEQQFKEFTNKDRYRYAINNPSYSVFYDFSDAQLFPRLKLAELWTLESETRYRIIDTKLNDIRLAEFGLTEDQIVDQLLTFALEERLSEMERNGEVLEDEEQVEALRVEIAQSILDRFVIEETIEPIWYKSVFTYDTLFERERSPFPHGCHPYTAFFAQFTDGYFSSIIDDSKDVIIALNKAYMFRELMLNNSAKGLLVVDQNALASSGLSVDDVADEWSQIGGVIALKLKPGKTGSLNNSIFQVTNTAQNLQSVNELIRDYEAQLGRILGVAPAQLGLAKSDTPTGRFRMEIAQGQTANGIMFNNFERSLRDHYRKTIPLISNMMRDKKEQVVRTLGENQRTWIEYEINEDFGLFDDAIRQGIFTLTLVPVEEDPQINNTYTAQLMQMAMAGVSLTPTLEVALKYSTIPNRMDIVKDLAKARTKEQRTQAALMVDLQMVQQLALQSGLAPDQVEELIRKLQIERYAQLQQQRQAKSQFGQGIGEIQKQATEPIRQTNIQNQQS